MSETRISENPSAVYYWDLRASQKAPFDVRMRKLLKATEIAKYLRTGDLVALKIHFGERGSTGFISPQLIKPWIKFFQKSGTKPFLTDTNTLYTGERNEAVSHLLQAAEHGFDPNLLGAPLIIADGIKSNNQETVQFPGKHFENFYLAGDIVRAEQLLNLAHFKGHILTGFGGALKNLGMGCATRRGKMQQHCDLAPMLKKEFCQGCGECIRVCSPGALYLNPEGIIGINQEECIGCASCVHTCPTGAIKLNWQVDIKISYSTCKFPFADKPGLRLQQLQRCSDLSRYRYPSFLRPPGPGQGESGFGQSGHCAASQQTTSGYAKFGRQICGNLPACAYGSSF